MIVCEENGEHEFMRTICELTHISTYAINKEQLHSELQKIKGGHPYGTSLKCLKIDDKMEQLLVMIGVPLPKITPEQWLKQHTTAYDGASNEVWWLEDGTYDEDCLESTMIMCQEWFDLYDKLTEKLLLVAKRENGSK